VAVKESNPVHWTFIFHIYAKQTNKKFGNFQETEQRHEAAKWPFGHQVKAATFHNKKITIFCARSDKSFSQVD